MNKEASSLDLADTTLASFSNDEFLAILDVILGNHDQLAQLLSLQPELNVSEQPSLCLAVREVLLSLPIVTHFQVPRRLDLYEGDFFSNLRKYFTCGLINDFPVTKPINSTYRGEINVREMLTIELQRDMTTEEVFNYLRFKKFRPGRLEDLVEFGLLPNGPDCQNLIGLGSNKSFKEEDDNGEMIQFDCYMFLDRDSSLDFRGLCPTIKSEKDNVWPKGTKFLAIQK